MDGMEKTVKDDENKKRKPRTRRSQKKNGAAENDSTGGIPLEGNVQNSSSVASNPAASTKPRNKVKKSMVETLMERKDMYSVQYSLASQPVPPMRRSYTSLQKSMGHGDAPLPHSAQHGENYGGHWSEHGLDEIPPVPERVNCSSNTVDPGSSRNNQQHYQYSPRQVGSDQFYFASEGDRNNSHKNGQINLDDYQRQNSGRNCPIPGINSGQYSPVRQPCNRYFSPPGNGTTPSQGRNQHPSSYEAKHKGQQQNNQNNKRQHQANRFERYWSRLDLSAGLKRNELIAGAIRINPKNYEDAYVPLPDGSSDIYVSGMKNRNRALNGDIVAVKILDRESWRVYENDLENYEKNQKKLQCEAEDAKKDDNSSDSGDDSGPDVVVESEIVEKNENIETKNKQKIPELKKDINNSNKRVCNKKMYMSVKDVLDIGSPVAKDLFHSQNSTTKVNNFVQKVGKVVGILECKHSRAASGHIKLLHDKSKETALFSPFDHRLPRIHIPMSECPKDFDKRPEDHATTIFIARIVNWEETSQFAEGQLTKSLGEAGLIEPETDALLIENDVDFSEFSEEAIQCLPKNLPWRIPECELNKRRDFRKECIFTIDPATARDLDDAVSCKSLGNDMFEIGVHIADVSYFIEPRSALDKVAAERATSVYLTQKVIPMLPRLLCEQLCSLNPDEDRLSFSVCWKMNSKGEISEEWFGRSIIRSCVKLSYNHAQGFIDYADKVWNTEELPPISKGFTVDDIKSRTLILHKIACNLRKNRFDQGALRLDQVKLQFSLDKDTGLPNGYTVYQQRESNRLIEEFMLLANMAVATKINSSFPEKAMLRCHPPPQTKMIDDLKKTCEELGVDMNVSSSQAIHQSILRYVGNDEFSIARMQVLVALCSKPMQNAKYFCAGMFDDEHNYHHYALNVPLYTHFTSPIRRYPDVMVHRLLAAALAYSDPPLENKEDLHKQANHCNDKKTNAKRCSEVSNDIFFSVFVKEAGPFDERGMVMAVLDRSFDVFILKLGVVKRVYCDKLEIKEKIFEKGAKVPKLTLLWPVTDDYPKVTRQEITIFSMVNCILKADLEPLKWTAYIKRPRE